MSGDNDQDILLLEDTLLQKGSNESGTYTRDGSVDFHGRPVLKDKTGDWKACFFILGNEGCVALAFCGIDTNLVNYLTGNLHERNVSAASIVSTWSGTCFLTPLLGAFLADAYWGRYWTIVVSSMAYFVGMCILIFSASIPALQPAECMDSNCLPASRGEYALFFAGLYLMALGAGGIKPCGIPFGADQFDDTDSTERVKKASFFNWLLFSTSIGFRNPEAAHLQIYRDIVASIRKVKLDVPNDSDGLYETPDQNLAAEGRFKEQYNEVKFLDKVALSSDAQISVYDNSNPRISCSVTEVKQLTILLRMFPIWVTGIVYCAVYSQTLTVFVEQGMVMDRTIASFRVPAASLSLFMMISILLWVPFYDKFLLPFTIKFTGIKNGLSELQSFGTGLFLSVLPMLCAAFVEMRRLQLVMDLGIVGEKVDAPLSICWQIPQYLLIGISDAMAFAGRFGFFYDQSPNNMKSLGIALCLLNNAMGQYLSSFILTIVSAVTTSAGSQGWIPDDLNKGQLHKYFFLWAGLSFLNFLVFVFFATRYKDKRTL
ncbi:hypothetical protein KSS87_004189 [Heliosperma pusillum]|nr:hypothetical protein KSS87_004189 [Heliosperma pusillum]